MKRPLAVAALVGVLAMSQAGCFTAMGVAHGASKQNADGSDDMGAVIGYALLGALVDSALFTVIVFASVTSSDDGDSFRRAP